ncbi:ribonuclease P protein component [Candidatus Dojkabacteria bacterium]|nr:ribonuclease P protein component [Candidatus Dojkabacteria bacterium]
MLPRKNRISKADFKRIFKKGKACHTDFFVLLYLLNPEIDEPQMATVAGLKVGRAVKRNRAKRKVRAILHNYLPQILPKYQIVVICKPRIHNMDAKSLQKNIFKILQREKLLKPDKTKNI